MAQETDIYDDENSIVLPKMFKTWGQVVGVDRYEAVWDAGLHTHVRCEPGKGKYKRIEIVIIPIDEMQFSYNTKYQSNTTGWGHEDWVKTTRPSIKALFGVEAGFLDMLLDKYVYVEQKENGKTYTKKTGSKAGETGILTDFLFVKLFASMDACTADYLETKAGNPVTAASDAAFPATDVPLNVPPVAVHEAKLPDDLLFKFAQTMIDHAAKNAPGDEAKITELARVQISANPLFADRFTVESVEIRKMIDAAIPAVTQ